MRLDLNRVLYSMTKERTTNGVMNKYRANRPWLPASATHRATHVIHLRLQNTAVGHASSSGRRPRRPRRHPPQRRAAAHLEGLQRSPAGDISSSEVRGERLDERGAQLGHRRPRHLRVK